MFYSQLFLHSFLQVLISDTFCTFSTITLILGDSSNVEPCIEYQIMWTRRNEDAQGEGGDMFWRNVYETKEDILLWPGDLALYDESYQNFY